jgi:hypothetical protein
LLLGVLLLAGSMIGLAFVQYLMPPSFDNPPAVNHAGIVHFRSVLPIAGVTPLSVPAFVWIFRLLLATAWIGYGTILLISYRYDAGIGRYTLPAVGGLALLLAVLFPPSLSSDVYAYVGWGRMAAIYDWSPYDRTLRSLAELGDPAGLIAPVGASTTHGPVWIALVSAVVGLLRSAGLWVQVVALKLLAGAALLAAAVSGREVARSYDPRRAQLALLAIGFNPVFLIEGPGNGHNDALMVALMLAGIALWQKGRTRAGYLLVGLSIGIKFVSAAIVPWLIMEQVVRRKGQRQLAATGLALGLMLAPTAAGYAAFRVNTNALAGIGAVVEHQIGGSQATVPASDAAVSEQSPTRPTTLGVVPRIAVLLAVYAVLSLAVWRSSVPGMYLSCWALFCMTLIVVGAPVAFAWYMIWPLSASLIRWDRYGVTISVACAVLSIFLLARYTAPYVR